MVQVFIVDFFLRIGKKVFFQNCQKALNSVMHWQISEFSTSRFFYPSSFFTHLIELVEMSKKSI